MNVTAFRIWNFMGFEDSDWIELRPITLLFGRNSTGKSVILRALLVLKQSLDVSSEYGPLRLSSEQGVDAGTYWNVVHGHDIERVLSFGFKCRVGAERLQYLQLEVGADQAVVTFRLGFSLDSQTGHINLQDMTIQVPDMGGSSVDKSTIFGADRVTEGDKPDWWFWSDFLEEYEHDEMYNVWPYVNLETGPGAGFFPFLDVQEAAKDHEESWGNDFNYIAELLSYLKVSVTSFLESLDYFGPMRSEPQRFYRLAESALDLVGGRGTHALRKYASQTSELVIQEKQEIDDRLSELGFQAALDTNRFHKLDELGQQIDVPLFDMTLTEPNGLEVNLCDVGFGVSQALPLVIASVLAEQGTTLIIEQPELHLHPSAQAELGDLFIRMANAGIQLLIETHSENLILRLRRRMAETTLALRRGESPELSIQPDTLRAYFVDRVGGISACEPIQYDEWGKYLRQPPGFLDFFGNDFDELMALDDARLEATKEG